MMSLDLAQARLAVPLLEKFFFSRLDAVAIAQEGGTPQPAGASLRAILSTHVAGKLAPPAVVRHQSKSKLLGAGIGHFRVGSYCLNAESQVRWLCLDFDAGSGHANALEDPTGTALAFTDGRGCRFGRSVTSIVGSALLSRVQEKRPDGMNSVIPSGLPKRRFSSLSRTATRECYPGRS